MNENDSNARGTRNTGAAERRRGSLRLFSRCIPRSSCCSSHRQSLGPLCLQRLDLDRQKLTFLFQTIGWISRFIVCPEASGMYLCWGVCGPARCSLCSWSFCRRCRVHSATCKLSLSHPSSGQTGRCMTSRPSWQPTNHTSSALIKCIASWLHKRNPCLIGNYSKYAVILVKTVGVF